ncbi:RseA family anti-sigma factor [Halomonas denitrificans]|nr:sigma-E factor negative regulatory protein [Halomonas denitrificans]
MERNNEHLSALVDGELDRRESAFLLRRLTTDAELQDDWTRYHMTRACLHNEFPGRVDLVDRVRAAIADERVDPVARMSPLARFGIGGALAAGIAMIAVVGLDNRIAPGPEVAEPAPAFVSQSSALDRQFSRQAVPAGFSELPASPAATPADDPRERISRYIIRHGQASGASNFVSFTPILTSDAPVTAVPLETTTAEDDGTAVPE